MGFELVAPAGSATIDHAAELLFDVAQIAGLPLPVLHELADRFYDSPRFNATQARALGADLGRLADAIQQQPESLRRAWKRRPPAFRETYGVPEAPTMVAKLQELVAVCEAGWTSGQGIHGLSD